MKGLDFISTHWERLQKEATTIQEELPKVSRAVVGYKNSPNLFIVKNSELGNTWSPNLVSEALSGTSNTLTVLSDKIRNMILKGRGEAVKRMLISIASGKIKVWAPRGKRLKRREKNKGGNSFLGDDILVGHFRWNFKGHVLDKTELRQIKKYFKL